jgi:NIPSNAP
MKDEKKATLAHTRQTDFRSLFPMEQQRHGSTFFLRDYFRIGHVVAGRADWGSGLERHQKEKPARRPARNRERLMIRKVKSSGYRLCLLLGLLFFVSHSQRAMANSEEQRPIHQLRIYEIFEGNKQAFHNRFRDHAMRIMAKYDFKIVAIWETRTGDRTEFVYLLEWPDKETMTDRWAKFMADQEWADIKKETAKVHGRLVGDIQDRVLQLKDYSPNKTLLK